MFVAMLQSTLSLCSRFLLLVLTFLIIIFTSYVCLRNEREREDSVIHAEGNMLHQSEYLVARYVCLTFTSLLSNEERT